MSTSATWGIPGPAFLAGYPVLLLAAVVAVRPLQGLIGPRHPDAVTALRPVEIGLLRGSDRLAVTAAMARLRAADLVDEHGSPRGDTTTTRAGDTFEDVLLDELGDRKVTRQVDRMVRWPAVRTALDEVRAGLADRGWIRGRRATTAARALSLLPCAVLALGVARVVVGRSSGRPVGLLVLELLAGAAVVFHAHCATTTPPTPAARRELQRLRRQHPHLHPRLRPSWSAYGSVAAGTSVALWGAGALAVAEPAFAAAIAPIGRVGFWSDPDGGDDRSGGASGGYGSSGHVGGGGHFAGCGG